MKFFLILRHPFKSRANIRERNEWFDSILFFFRRAILQDYHTDPINTYFSTMAISTLNATLTWSPSHQLSIVSDQVYRILPPRYWVSRMTVNTRIGEASTCGFYLTQWSFAHSVYESKRGTEQNGMALEDASLHVI